MKKNKGFTLVEMLGVAIILGLLIVLVVPNLMSVYKRTQEKRYDLYINRLREASIIYAENNKDKIEGLNSLYNNVYIILQDLIDAGLLKAPVIDPSTNEKVSPQTSIGIKKVGTKEYEVDLFVTEFVRVVAFNSSGTFTVPVSVNKVDVLVVAGGGGGGGNGGAGGGAGGLVFEQSYPVSLGSTIDIVIGAGGLGSSVPNGTRFNGGNGGNSHFGTIIANGGGGGSAGGSSVTTRNGANGGSGGGGAAYGSGTSGLGGSGITNQGFKGGDASATSSNFRSAGGGGAGGPATNLIGGTTDIGGVGGVGLDFSHIFSIEFGDNGVFASGGSGYLQPTVESGGGGASGNDGMANTGGGGGNNGNGGSGIVIVKYIVTK